MASLIGTANLFYIGFYLIFKKSNVFIRDVIRSAPSVVFCISVFSIYNNTVWGNAITVIWVWPIYMLFSEFLFLLLPSQKRTYFQKMEAQEENVKQIYTKLTLFDLFAYKTSLLIISYLIAAIPLFYIFANNAGATEAKMQKSFWVVREPKPLVVLRIYGDKFVCAPFDSKSRIVEKTLYILDTPKQEGLWLDWQQIGPLKPADGNRPKNISP